jgi:hypothetical protein
MSAFEASCVLRDALTTVARNSLISPENIDFFEFDPLGIYLKVPVRDECIVGQPITPNRYIALGDKWGPDGTITAPICPLRGTVITNVHDFAHDPTTAWTGADWYKSIGGWIFKALSNNIRANKYATEAQLIKIVMALIEYMDMGRSLMYWETYNALNYDNPIAYILDTILASSSGSPLFSIKDELTSKLILNIQDAFYPWPWIPFWAMRRCCAYSKQSPWIKYLVIVPFSAMIPKNLARFFDAYIGADQWVNPETYLRAEGLWNLFRDNILPIIWNKLPYEAYLGHDYRAQLQNVGWRPISYDQQYLEFIRRGFFLHPFSETLGVGQDKLPKRGFTDTVTTMEAHYWDSNGHGRKFILNADAFMVSNRNKEHSIVRSPWLDPVEFLWHILNNNSSNDDSAVATEAPSLAGLIASNGAVAELAWDEYLGIFLHHALEYNKFESIEPEPDIDVYSGLTETGVGDTFLDYFEYFDGHIKVPVKLPDLHWYHDHRKLYKFGCAIMNIKPNDVELYRVQRDRIEQSGSVQSNVQGG